VVLRKIAAPDSIVLPAELVEDVQRIDTSQSHDRQEPAEPNRHRKARAKKHTIR
jgi:hypothetical protein